MEAPPLSPPPPLPATITTTPRSADSSPNSGRTTSSDADPPPPPKLRLMCSYGGHIVPRPHDKTLCYVGGDTRIVAVDRRAPLSDLHRRLSRSLLHNQPFALKYQLPNEDLDSLVSVATDEDLENMVEEYDRLNSPGSKKTGRLRLFLFPKTSSSCVEQILAETASTKSEDWFFNALNGKASSDRGFSESSSVNCLLGLDDEYPAKAKDVEPQIEGSKIGFNGNGNGNHVIINNQDVHSIPDSPMLETSSSFGSTSSSPSVANLPPIRVRADENLRGMGIEEQFQQMNVGNVNLHLPPLKQEEVGVFMAAGTVVSGMPAVVGGGEYANRVISDDERSDHGGYRKVQQIQPQVQPQQQIPQFQQKPTGVFDLPSPDSVSSEGSITNPLSRQRQAIYQEPLIQIQSSNTRIPSKQVDLKTMDQNNTKIQMQPQGQESGYIMPAQFDQNHPQLHHNHQFVHAGNQYISAGAMPVGSYYSIYPPQQQHPVYFVPGRQNQAYNLPLQQQQQPNYTELAPSRNIPSSKPEMANGVYQIGPQLVQVPSSQHQPHYVGYTQIHQPSYEFSEPNHGRVYYKPLPPQLAAQYQTLTSSSPGMVVHDASSQVSVENIKQQG